ncbi:MAG: N-6 DNA methylase, partial [Myxococcota bacterium]
MSNELLSPALRALEAAWALLEPRARCAPCEAIFDAVSPVVGEDTAGAWLDTWGARASRPRALDVDEGVDVLLALSERKRHGIFFTPRPLALAMARRVGTRASGGPIVDLSAGDGALLAAAIEVHPGASVVGVERDPSLGVMCAVRLLYARHETTTRGTGAARADRVIVGDGLTLRDELIGRAGACLANPPYLGEKGNREVFAEIRRAHPDLAQRMRARTDLFYLFLHRALDVLEVGAPLVALTSAYWMQATGAAELRRDVMERASPELLVSLEGTGVFSGAPSQHSAIVVARRGRSAT